MVHLPQWLQGKAHRGGQAVPLWKSGRVYLHTHTHTRETSSHYNHDKKMEKKSHSHKKHKFEIINSTSVCQIIISSPLRKRTKLHSV